MAEQYETYIVREACHWKAIHLKNGPRQIQTSTATCRVFSEPENKALYVECHVTWAFEAVVSTILVLFASSALCPCNKWATPN